MEQRQLLIPRRLDDPPRFFFWEFDVALIFCGLLMFGIMANMVLTGSAFGIFLASWYSKIKGGNQRGYGIHLFYWNFPVSMGFKRTPPSAIRDFIG